MCGITDPPGPGLSSLETDSAPRTRANRRNIVPLSPQRRLHLEEPHAHGVPLGLVPPGELPRLPEHRDRGGVRGGVAIAVRDRSGKLAPEERCQIFIERRRGRDVVVRVLAVAVSGVEYAAHRSSFRVFHCFHLVFPIFTFFYPLFLFSFFAAKIDVAARE